MSNQLSDCLISAAEKQLAAIHMALKDKCKNIVIATKLLIATAEAEQDGSRYKIVNQSIADVLARFARAKA